MYKPYFIISMTKVINICSLILHYSKYIEDRKKNLIVWIGLKCGTASLNLRWLESIPEF